MTELERALIQGIGLTPAKAAKRVGAIREHFADAVVQGSEALIPAMTNPVKDRHVLAAAVRSKSDVIVTLNLRDFPDAVLAPFFCGGPAPGSFSDRAVRSESRGCRSFAARSGGDDQPQPAGVAGHLAPRGAKVR